jgi:hypothetical protein
LILAMAKSLKIKLQTWIRFVYLVSHFTFHVSLKRLWQQAKKITTKSLV